MSAISEKKNRATAIGGDVPTNGAEETIQASIPFIAKVTIEGTADLLFHRWNCEAVQAKAEAAKGSKAKKTDNIETYVYRDENDWLCLPGEYLRQSIVNAAKFQQDPRSPRKSAMDLYKAAVVSLTHLAPIFKDDYNHLDKWDYEDKRRVTVQRAGVTRTRPAFRVGWRATVELMVTLPEYIAPNILNATIQAAGRLVGVGDFRPTYGRFQVIEFLTSKSVSASGN